MKAFDRHSAAVTHLLSELLPTAVDRRPSDRPFRVVEVGCGKSLEYTTLLLKLLSEAGVARVNLTLIDPVIDEARLKRLKASAGCFENLLIEPYQCSWDKWCERRPVCLIGFDLAVSIQLTSLFSDTEAGVYFRQIAASLSPTGNLVDVCEDNDMLTDRGTWGDLQLFQRDANARIKLADDQGLAIIHSSSCPAHHDATDDGRMMTGLVFASESAF